MERIESANHNTLWIIERWKDRRSWEAGEEPYHVSKAEGNVLLNEGINVLWSLAAGGAGTAFSNANSYIGVGSDATAAAAVQTGLQAAVNKLYAGMDDGFPTFGTSQKITFKSTFDSDEANFAWNEFTVANGNSDASVNLNRKVSAQGTKVLGQVWSMTIEITLT
jgi:hypothetical protein